MGVSLKQRNVYHERHIVDTPSMTLLCTFPSIPQCRRPLSVKQFPSQPGCTPQDYLFRLPISRKQSRLANRLAAGEALSKSTDLWLVVQSVLPSILHMATNEGSVEHAGVIDARQYER